MVIRNVPHLLDNWADIAPSIREAEAIALFLDFDGTLAPTRARPEQAAMAPEMRRTLQLLLPQTRIRVWAISGRRLEDLRRRIALPGVHCLGLHGWEDQPNRKPDMVTRLILMQVRDALARRIGSDEGAWLEDKEAAITVHYRGSAPAASQHARVMTRHVTRIYRSRLRLCEADMALEIVPREIGDKGIASRNQWQAFNGNALPVYLGNDGTDEPAFEALNSGITVRVGPQSETSAKFRLRDPDEVRRFLGNLSEAMQ